jgi:carbonic anhydrase
MAVVDEFLEANARYAVGFAKGELPTRPVRKVAVVVCMDARIDPARVLGLQEGDAHVIRNAGGRAADAIRSLIISQHLLGTEEVVVIHHTDCGMVTFTDEELRSKLKADLGHETDLEFLPVQDLEAGLRADVASLKAEPLLVSVSVHGLMYDVRTGRLQEVVGA